MNRTHLALALLLPLAACGSTTTVEGNAFVFNGAVEGVEGARVFVLEDPSLEATTDTEGYFLIEGVPVGSDVSLVMEHPDYIPIQTGTHVVPEEGLSRITFQAVTPLIESQLAALLMVSIDESACQMVTTVTRIGRSLYEPGAHGEEGATVTIDPPLPASSGPIYFTSDVIPDRSLTETTDDGGVLFVNVPEGEYTWTATKDGATFASVRMKCRAGFLINASPPAGLQRL